MTPSESSSGPDSDQTQLTLCEGRYALGRVLGKGGMATVYQARDTRLDVTRAVKVLHPETTRKRGLRKRFEAEARTMARLQHAHIVQVFDAGGDGELAFMVMEYLGGGSLMDRIDQRGPLTPRVAIEVMIAVLTGLDAAHREGVVHRDVKPHNVLLTLDGKPKVTDFGIAHVTRGDMSITRTGAVMGTWAYMAPEQRIDAKQVDARSDLYAAGGTLYALLTGREPFDLHSPDSHALQLKDVEPALAEVIKRATRFHPEDRYATAAAMTEDMVQALASLPALPGDAVPLVVPRQRLPARSPARVSDDATHGEEPPPLIDLGFRPGTAAETHLIPASETPAPPRHRATETSEQPTLYQEEKAFFAAVAAIHAAPHPAPAAATRRGPGVWIAAGGAAVLLLAAAALLATSGGDVGEAAGAGGGEAQTAPVEPLAPATEPAPEPPVATLVVADPEIPTVEESPTPPPEAAPPTPVAAPAPRAKAPATATVRVAVDEGTRGVQLLRDGKAYPVGSVPPGTYTIEATFGEKAPVSTGTLTVEAGKSYLVRCDSLFVKCIPR
jgi:serine/threonine protein kinase